MRSSSNTGIDQFPRHNSLKGNACVTKVTGIQFETLGLQLFEVNFFFCNFHFGGHFICADEGRDRQTDKQTNKIEARWCNESKPLESAASGLAAINSEKVLLF